MSDYELTTDRMREIYTRRVSSATKLQRGQEFDRWLSRILTTATTSTTGAGRIITEGERWQIADQLDGATVMIFDSWSHHDPEARAREAFEHYPRVATLWREWVVSYELQLVEYRSADGRDDPDAQLERGGE